MYAWYDFSSVPLVKRTHVNLRPQSVIDASKMGHEPLAVGSQRPAIGGAPPAQRAGLKGQAFSEIETNFGLKRPQIKRRAPPTGVSLHQGRLVEQSWAQRSSVCEEKACGPSPAGGT